VDGVRAHFGRVAKRLGTTLEALEEQQKEKIRTGRLRPRSAAAQARCAGGGRERERERERDWTWWVSHGRWKGTCLQTNPEAIGWWESTQMVLV
jgi:hypothetical protein